MKKWIDIHEFLAVRELNKSLSEQVLAHIWHDNYLKVQEIGLEAYLKQFEDE